MYTATLAQLGFIRRLAADKGFDSIYDAAAEFGIAAWSSTASWSVRDASLLIDWLQAPVKTADELAAEAAAAEEARVAAEARATAAAAEKAERDAAFAVEQAAIARRSAACDRILAERFPAGLNGKARRDARYAITRELKEQGL